MDADQYRIGNVYGGNGRLYRTDYYRQHAIYSSLIYSARRLEFSFKLVFDRITGDYETSCAKFVVSVQCNRYEAFHPSMRKFIIGTE